MKILIMPRLAMVGIVLLLSAFVAHVGAEVANAAGKDRIPSVISTSFLQKPAGAWAGCGAINVGTSSVTVYMELRGIDGDFMRPASNLTDYPSAHSFTIEPGHGIIFDDYITEAHHVWCRFTMESGSSDDIRAKLRILGSDGIELVGIEAR